MTRNIAPTEGGPTGGQLEAKIGAYYMLAMLCESEARGLPGGVARLVKFQRGYEGHALDDIVVEGVDAAGTPVALEIQAKRTLDFTASDEQFAKLIAQIAGAAGDPPPVPLAAAIGRTSAKIERHYHQLLLLARKMSSGEGLRRALDAPRVLSAGMRDFAEAVRAQMRAAGASDSDEALWSLLRRFQILVFDFESPGAVSTLLVEALAKASLPVLERNRHHELWSALVEKALSYDADGGEITRAELVKCLTHERGLNVVAGRGMALARQRFAAHSAATLAAIDDRIAGIALDRSSTVEAIAKALDVGRFVEIVGDSGSGKSALLKALAEEERLESRPFVLSPARTPRGGWLSLASQLGFEGSAPEFLVELAASGCTAMCFDGLDRVSDESVRATIIDLIIAAAKVPMMRVVATVGRDFSVDQRHWLPETAIVLLGRASVSIGPLNDDEVAELASADGRLAQLLSNREAQPLTRNLFQLRQLISRSAGPLPLTEAALARSWWEAGTNLARIQHRDRLKALRALARQAVAQVTQLDISDIGSAVTEDLVQADELEEIFEGSRASFRHDVLRDWSVANLLYEEPGVVDELPLDAVAPIGLARAMEIYARLLIEREDGVGPWDALVARVGAIGVHGSWRRAVLLALVRSEQATTTVLDRAFGTLAANAGHLLQELIRYTAAADSESAVELLEAAGLQRSMIPESFRIPTGLSWARLTIWLLARLEQIDAPIGRDVLHLFTLWLMANAGRDPIKPLIVKKLYTWLVELEGRKTPTGQTETRRLFAYDGRYGKSHGLTQEIRALFLMSCDGDPDLAAAYIRAHTGVDERYDVVGDILKFTEASAKAAPAALAAFTVDALVTAEQRYEERHGSWPMGRLSRHRHDMPGQSPSQGPFLGILRASPIDGLKLVRRIVDYGVGLDHRSNSDPGGEISLSLPTGNKRFAVPGSYFLSRSGGSSPVMTSALRALEAWGHEQVEAGHPVLEVVYEILGDGDAPAAFLAVAVDVLLSHVSGPDPALIPFVTSPELLKLDWDRFTRDRIGLDRLETDEGPPASGAATNASLQARRSRKTSLIWSAPEFLFGEDEALAESLRARLIEERSRLELAGRDAPLTTHDARWHADRALRLLDPSNWREVEIPLQHGGTARAREYVEPANEAEVLDPLRQESSDSLAETVLVTSLVEALLDPSKQTADLIERGLIWAHAQSTKALAEDEEDFNRAQHWRAVIATAALSVVSPAYQHERAWATKILQRAVREPKHDRHDRAHAQVRFHSAALASLGWAGLAAQGDADARRVLLTLSKREDSAIIAAIGSALEALALADARLPKALLRIGLASSIHPEQIWDDAAANDLGRLRREERLAEAVASEEAWLSGGDEPAWPALPQTRQIKRRRRIVTKAATFDDEDDRAAEERRPSEWVNHQAAGSWLTAVEHSNSINTSPWIAELVQAYQQFSDYAWGAGLPADAELGELPASWLHPFGRLRLRAAVSQPWEDFASAVVTPLIALPDESFLEAIEAFVPAADSLFWDDKILSLEHLVRAREAVSDRLKRCRLWQWGKDELTDSVARNVAGGLRALFFHTPVSFTGAVCYLPISASPLAAVFPALAALTQDAPGLSFVAELFITASERANGWAPIDLVLSAAEAWAGARGSETTFWRDQGFGRRICAWFAHRAVEIENAEPLAKFN